jgi:mono/diheme cytochrome c family protein
MPHSLRADQLPSHAADLANGERMFWVGGCASCHAAPGANEQQRLLLEGGDELATPFGTFRSPNISPDLEHGIGSWTLLEFVNAMVRGISPDGRHYYPAFPYPYYTQMHLEDVIDLKAFLDTLPPSPNAVLDHSMKFPYSIRRGLGLWKRLYLDSESNLETDLSTPLQVGQYLVTGPGHCGACHTPRDSFGGEINTRLLAGARSLEQPTDPDHARAEWIPNITPHKDGLAAWSELDIAYALETGFDPQFDTFGGSMVEVQENMAKLPANDRLAIATYLKWIPALPTIKDTEKDMQ